MGFAFRLAAAMVGVALLAMAAAGILLALGVDAATASLIAGAAAISCGVGAGALVVRNGADGAKHAQILDKILESMADGLLVVDDKGRTVYANKELIRLFGDKESIGSPQWQQTHRRFRPDGVTPFPPEETPIGRAMRGEAFDNLEIVMRNDVLKEVRLFANGRPMWDASGKLIGAVIVYRDITVEWDTARQLQHTRKIDAIGQLTGGIAHDFNNILMVIIGSIEAIGEKLGGRHEAMELVRTIDEAAERGAGLITQLLAFARKQSLQPRQTNINALVDETERLIRPTLGEHVEIEVIRKPDAWPALVDPHQLTTALINLAVNARDAMQNGGKLTIETDNTILDNAYAATHPEVTPGEHVLIAVTDTGTGIPAAIRDKVFEPFFTTKEVGKGTGLGLSMVYGFVKQSGGHISIYSEENHGTSIKIYLPRADVKAGSYDEATASKGVRGGKEIVLVVEDDKLVRNNVIMQLESLGYRTIQAANGAEALKIAETGTAIDLMLTDVIMPGMNGRQLAQAIAVQRPGLKVLFTSGYTENAMAHQGQIEPGVQLLAKPYRKADLARMVRSVIDAPPLAADLPASDDVLAAVHGER